MLIIQYTVWGENITIFVQASMRLPLSNRMAWQWAETLMEIRGTLADITGTTK